jgi:hypothetical protein
MAPFDTPKWPNQDKAAYVAGFSDATNSSLGKLDNLRLAAGAFHWKGANKILADVARGLDISDPCRFDSEQTAQRTYGSQCFPGGAQGIRTAGLI